MSRKSLGRCAAAVAVLLLLSGGSARLWGQTTTSGSVAGVVTDPSGAVIPETNMTLKDVDRGSTQGTTTNQVGAYRFDLLLPGKYSVTAARTGFQTFERSVDVNVGRVTTADFQLTIGTASTTVEVSGQAPLVETDSGNLASTILETQAANIPNPGNDLTYMAQIAPGTVANTAGGGLGNFSSYGISAVANLFTINGMDDNDPFLNLNNSGATNLTLGQNEVQEVSIVTNGYSGQYHGLAGANVNYITRGGTNEFHGRATWLWNGSAMNANSWFNDATQTPKSFVNANQYGGDFGGPIKKNKLFAYANFEGLYLVIPTSVQALVPSPQFESAVQANINTQFASDTKIQQFYQTMFKLYNGAPGGSRAKDTLPDHGCDGSESSINTVANGYTFGTNDPLLNPLGAGTPCALDFFSNVNNKTHENLQAYRVDWNITNHDRFFTRIQHDHGLQATITDAINPLFNVQSDQPEWQGQANETHDFSNGAVNQFIVSGQWYSALFGLADPSASFSAFPTTVLFASGQLSDVGGLDFDFPQGRRVTQFQVSDDFSRPFGKHTLKAGGEYRRNWITNTDYSIFSTGLIVPINLASFFAGGSDGNTEIQQSFPTSLEQPFAVYTVGGYAEDDWKVKPSLTLTISFRLDHPSNPVCFHDCFARPAKDFPQLSTDPTTPYNQLMVVALHQMLPGLTSVEPQPRFGFAWEPHVLGLRNTVVRGGIGIFYDNFPGSLLDGFSENPPYDPTCKIFGGSPARISSPSDSQSLFASASASNAAFQSGFKNGASVASLLAAVPGFAAPGLAASVNDPKVPQYQKWSFEVEHQFGRSTSLSLQYVGNHGIHIYTENDGINGCNVVASFTSLPACNPTTGAGVNPSFLNVNYAESIGVSNYNGLTTSFTHRYSSGLVQVNYTWSHALDTASNSGIPSDAFGNTSFGATNNSMVYPENPANPREFNYGNADYDARHVLNANFVWELPIKRVLAWQGPDMLLRGWQVSGSVFFRTGLPFTLVNNALSTALQAGGYGSSANLVDIFGIQTAPGGTGVNCAAAFPTTPQPNRNICLNGSNFFVPTSANPQTTFGNVGRNTIRGPDYFDADFSLMKNIKATERTKWVIGAQFYNIFNHPNFDAPVMDVSSTRFGQIIKTVSPPTTLFGSGLGADASPRLIQLKVQFSF